jgi:hypothetical protein
MDRCAPRVSTLGRPTSLWRQRSFILIKQNCERRRIEAANWSECNKTKRQGKGSGHLVENEFVLPFETSVLIAYIVFVQLWSYQSAGWSVISCLTVFALIGASVLGTHNSRSRSHPTQSGPVAIGSSHGQLLMNQLITNDRIKIKHEAQVFYVL